MTPILPARPMPRQPVVTRYGLPTACRPSNEVARAPHRPGRRRRRLAARCCIADWQIIADLSFADLVLWLPDREGTASGRARRCGRPPVRRRYVDDLVGTFVPAGRRPLLDAAYDQGRVVREGDPEWRDDVPVRVETIPVRRGEPGDRGDRAQHQPARRAHAQPAGAVLPPDRQRPDPDDQPRALPGTRAAAATTRTRRGSATGSCGSTPPGGWPTPSPNAQSVYRRLGLTGDLAGLTCSPS